MVVVLEFAVLEGDVVLPVVVDALVFLRPVIIVFERH